MNNAIENIKRKKQGGESQVVFGEYENGFIIDIKEQRNRFWWNWRLSLYKYYGIL